MSGYPADHYDDGYGHHGHGDSYYQDDMHGYYDTHDYGDSYYDRAYVSTLEKFLVDLIGIDD